MPLCAKPTRALDEAPRARGVRAASNQRELSLLRRASETCRLLAVCRELRVLLTRAL